MNGKVSGKRASPHALGMWKGVVSLQRRLSHHLAFVGVESLERWLGVRGRDARNLVVIHLEQHGLVRRRGGSPFPHRRHQHLRHPCEGASRGLLVAVQESSCEQAHYGEHHGHAHDPKPPYP